MQTDKWLFCPNLNAFDLETKTVDINSKIPYNGVA